MKTKRFLLAWLITYVVVFLLNGVFHGGIAASFFDNNLNAIGECVKKMKDSNPVPVAILDLILTFGMAFIIIRNAQPPIKRSDAILKGGLLNLISSGAWNLANTSMFNWPLIVTIGDVAWHVSLGCLGGYLIAIIYNFRRGNA